MSANTRWLSVTALMVAVSGLVLVGGRILLAPVQGDLLILASAPSPDRITASSIELHSSVGWTVNREVCCARCPRGPQDGRTAGLQGGRRHLTTP